MNAWILALRQINHYLLRSVLMAFGVSLFAATIVGVTVLLVGVQQSIQRVVDRLGADIMLIPQGETVAQELNEALISGKPTQFYMSRDLCERILEVEGVKGFSTQTYAQTLSNARCCAGHFFLVGFDPETDFTIQPWLKDWGGELTAIPKDGIIVGDRILLKTGDSLQLYGHTFTVACALNATGTGMDWTIFLPDTTLRQLVTSSVTEAESPLDIQPDQISALFIRAQQGVDLIDLAERLERDYPECQAVLSSSVGALARGHLKVGSLVSLFIVGALWIVAGLLSGVIFAQAVRERRAEFGLLQAKGATPGYILSTIVKEAFMIASVASLIGAGVALVIVFSFRELLALSLGVPQVLPDLHTLLFFVLGLCGFACISAVVCAALPAMKLMRMEPFEAIKQGGGL